MAKQTWLKISKLDAAERQVEMAIKLWFADSDPVSIHTLLFAAHDIIHGLHKRATGKTLFFDNAAMESRPDLRKIAKDWGNFFKHGRPYELDRVLEFNPDANLILFSACISGLARIGSPSTDLEMAQLFWFIVNRPDFFPEGFAQAHRPRGKTLSQLRRIKKQKFLERYLRSARKRSRSGLG